MTVDVLVAVVTWNSERHVGPLLGALPGATVGLRTRVVVADNASADATVARVRELAPSAAVVQLGANAGYAAGLNAAVAAGPPARAVLALNADVEPEPGSVGALVAAATASGVGVVVPLLVGPGGEVARSLRRRPTVLRAAGEALLGGDRSGRWAPLGEVVHDDRAYATARDVDWATGAAFLVTGPCWDAVGPLDESFFLYSEETDLMLRAADAGFRVRFEPRARIRHVGGPSRQSAALYGLLTANRARLHTRRHGRLRGAAFWTALAAGELLRAGRAPAHRAALAALCGRPPALTRPGLPAPAAPVAVAR